MGILMMHRTPGTPLSTDPELEYIVAALADTQHEPAGPPDDDIPARKPMNILGVTAMPREQQPLWIQITAIPIGLTIAAGFSWCLYYEMRSPPTHTAHIALFIGGIFFGLAIAFGRWFLFPVLTQTFLIVGPYLPMVGGRRSGDIKVTGERSTGTGSGERKP